MQPPVTLNCLVVDDEPLAREIICQYIEEIPGLQLAGECTNALQAMRFLQQSPVDLMFLDIRMPQLSGIDFLQLNTPMPRVIITTAYEEFALKGYELDVVDYLLKPIRFERFLKAVQKAFPKTAPATVPVLATTAASTVTERPPDPFVYFRADRKMVKVMHDDILYIESIKDYVKVITTKGVVISRYTLAALEAMLPAHTFLRVHRSFIVSVNKITSFTPELIEIGKEQLPVGNYYRQLVVQRLIP